MCASGRHLPRQVQESRTPDISYNYNIFPKEEAEPSNDLKTNEKKRVIFCRIHRLHTLVTVGMKLLVI